MAEIVTQTQTVTTIPVRGAAPVVKTVTTTTVRTQYTAGGMKRAMIADFLAALDDAEAPEHVQIEFHGAETSGVVTRLVANWRREADDE